MNTLTEDSTASLAHCYERDGYVVIEDVFTTEECRVLKDEGQRVLREKAGKHSVFVGVAASSELFYKLASDQRIVDPLKELMPDGVMFLSDKFVFKSGEQRFGTPWHCDEAYWRGTRPKISVWIPLDDATADNGALKVIPGGHKQSWNHENSHKPAMNGEFGSTIGSLADDPDEQAICEMRAGSMLIFSDLLPHASTPNTAGLDRYAIIGTYQAPAPDDEFDTQFAARHVIVAGKRLGAATVRVR